MMLHTVYLQVCDVAHTVSIYDMLHMLYIWLCDAQHTAIMSVLVHTACLWVIDVAHSEWIYSCMMLHTVCLRVCDVVHTVILYLCVCSIHDVDPAEHVMLNIVYLCVCLCVYVVWLCVCICILLPNHLASCLCVWEREEGGSVFACAHMCACYASSLIAV